MRAVNELLSFIGAVDIQKTSKNLVEQQASPRRGELR